MSGKDPPGPRRSTGRLEAALRRGRSGGRKLLVPYVTGGLGGEWPDIVRAVASAGADAIEIGVPFSDPVIDGPTIQLASARALAGGATPGGILDEISRLDAGVPLIVMTYYNIVLRAGHRRMAHDLAEVGVSAVILPDLPLDEASPWLDAAADAGVEGVLLAAPTTPDDRMKAICEASRGFVYGVGVMGVTGERDRLAASARSVARRLKATTDRPVLIGVGISTPEQAREVSIDADGVAVGSALVRRILDGAGPEGAERFVAELRAALDG